MTEDIMRGAIARIGCLVQVVVIDIIFHILVVGLNVFAVYLLVAFDSATAYGFAAYTVAASVGLTAKGALMLHRKWNEYVAMEEEAQNSRGDWRNPGLRPKPQNKLAVGIANGLAMIALPIPILLYSYFWIVPKMTTIGAALVVFSSLLMVMAGIYSWVRSSVD